MPAVDRPSLRGTARESHERLGHHEQLGLRPGDLERRQLFHASGATFSQPITLNIYDPSDTVNPNASATQTFAVPYRPSASIKCIGGRWYQWSSPASTV
jgi:hypothetical protein